MNENKIGNIIFLLLIAFGISLSIYTYKKKSLLDEKGILKKGYLIEVNKNTRTSKTHFVVIFLVDNIEYTIKSYKYNFKLNKQYYKCNTTTKCEECSVLIKYLEEDPSNNRILFKDLGTSL